MYESCMGATGVYVRVGRVSVVHERVWPGSYPSLRPTALHTASLVENRDSPTARLLQTLCVFLLNPAYCLGKNARPNGTDRMSTAKKKTVERAMMCRCSETWVNAPWVCIPDDEETFILDMAPDKCD